MSSVTINSNHSIVLINTTNGAKTIQLPLISDNPGRVIYFKDTFNTTNITNHIKLVTSNGDTFENGLTSNVITTTFQSYGLLANPFTSNWNIITKYDPHNYFVGISSLSSIVSYGLSSIRVDLGISSLSSIVSYGLSSLGGQTSPGISSLSSIVSYGLSSLRTPINPGVSSLSSIVSYGLSSINNLVNNSILTKSLEVYDTIYIGSNSSANYIAFSGCNNNFNNRLLAEYRDNLVLLAGADIGGINQFNNLALVASKDIRFYTNRSGTILDNTLVLESPDFLSDGVNTTFNTETVFNQTATFNQSFIASNAIIIATFAVNTVFPRSDVDIIGTTLINGLTTIDGNTIIKKTKSLELAIAGDDHIINYANYKPRFGDIYIPTIINLPSENIEDIKYYNGNFIAVGKSIYHSINGSEWQDISNTVSGGLASGQGYCVFYNVINSNWIVTGNWGGIPLYYTNDSTGLTGWTPILNNTFSYTTTDIFTYITINSQRPDICLIGTNNPSYTMYYTSNYADRRYYSNIVLDTPASGLIINYVYSLYSSSSVSYLATGSNTINTRFNVIYSTNGSNWYQPVATVDGVVTSNFFTNAGYGISTDLSSGIFIVVGDDISGYNIFISDPHTCSNFYGRTTVPLTEAIPLYDIQNLNTLQTDPNVQYSYYEPCTFILTSQTSNTYFIIRDINLLGTGATLKDNKEVTSPNRLAYYFGSENTPTLTVFPPLETQYTSPTTTGYGGIHIQPIPYSSNGHITGITFGTATSNTTGLSTDAGILTTSEVGPGTILHVMNSKDRDVGMEEIITINGNNNNYIGINQSLPQYRLDINGSINISETIYYNARKPLIVYMNISNTYASSTPITVDITPDNITYYDHNIYEAVISGWDIKGTTKSITTVTTYKNGVNDRWAVLFNCETSSTFITANFIFTISPREMYEVINSTAIVQV